MGMIKKSITVTDQQEIWIQQQLATGNYDTDSELIREALREKQNRTSKLEAIRAMLIEGEKSGVSPKTPDEIIDAVLKRRQENGSL